MCSKAFRFVLGIGLWWFCLVGWAAVDGGRLVEAARTQVGVTLGYDPTYRRIAYPGGDVPMATGVCTDVVIRALRAQGLDLQQRVHEDMRRHFSAYPRHWGLKRPDPNIDHRRVPNLMTWFDRQGLSLKVGQVAADYQPGDIVTWDLGRGLQHIGIISDRRSREGTPLALHNIGQGTREEDILFRWPILGHYRFAAH
ncbi:DUF1287 domain-containing protein [Pseudomonas sp. 1D4]|uniref:DUF1287 domain-containing protein n=1 Tax=Pseudomonadaceae TaxID=135621 RepID=UPI00084A9248|nr:MULTISPECIES: DUF1287 domain-containing protein [Pseudomonas]OEC40831.1 DUF1287 domain-containing protein [Pseudomonas sp. 1D4]OEC56912.1 DUF1287 domain-containing protein [Pseudomonas sp. ENNP23]